MMPAQSKCHGFFSLCTAPFIFNKHTGDSFLLLDCTNADRHLESHGWYAMQLKLGSLSYKHSLWCFSVVPPNLAREWALLPRTVLIWPQRSVINFLRSIACCGDIVILFYTGPLSQGALSSRQSAMAVLSAPMGPGFMEMPCKQETAMYGGQLTTFNHV